MELVKSARKHGSLVSEIIYILLNVALAFGVMALVYLFPNSPGLAYVLVVLSKWRVLAVRPRFWWDNFQANQLDLLLGISVVTMLWQAREVTWLQIAISGLYALWLVILKPLSSRRTIQTQAAIAQFVAITALFSTAYNWPVWVVVLAMWLVGYISARHVLVAYDEDDVTLLSLVWGLIVAELGWVAYHWTVAYSFGASDSIFKIPQAAIIIALLSYFTARVYSVYKSKGSAKIPDVIWHSLFALGIIMLLLIFFNGLNPNNS